MYCIKLQRKKRKINNLINGRDTITFHPSEISCYIKCNKTIGLRQIISQCDDFNSRFTPLKSIMADEKDTPKQADAATGQANKEETKEASAEDKATEEPKEEAPEEKKEEAKPKPEADQPKAEAEAEGEEVEVPAKFKDIVEKIENMAVLELNELVKLLEKKFGVSAAAVAVAGSAGGDADTEEKDEFTVELTSYGEAKIPVMKVVKEILGLGLKEAKDIVEGAPSVLKEGAKKVEAEEMKTKIEEAGGKVELK